MFSDYQLRSSPQADGTVVHTTEWTDWKTCKVCACCVCFLLVIAGAFFIFTRIDQSTCATTASPSTFDATKNGKNGWTLFVPNSINSMVGATLKIGFSSGSSILPGSPTTVSWANGAGWPNGTSTSYGTYQANVSITTFTLASQNIDVKAQLLLWCSDCFVVAPDDKCQKSIVAQWTLYEVSLSVPGVGSSTIVIAPRSGNIYLQGIFM